MSTSSQVQAVSGPLAGISFVGGVAMAMARSDAPYPLPGGDVAAI
jgi:hypothetical protein